MGCPERNTHTILLVVIFFFLSSHLDTRGSCLSPYNHPTNFRERVGRPPPPKSSSEHTQRRCWVEEGEYKRERGRRVGGEKKTLSLSLSLPTPGEEEGGLCLVCIRAPPLSEMADCTTREGK
ncbi:Uncharacterized protein APZ42_020252 [Daphnia magna]|uniref:Secreted protein n=1 Tax=Daphnia magna TaxID=35525 RepID=A0A164XN08_9CRUS|nr:Uncharacterized protein APZ42_020252 [Daphnia magna]